MKKNLLMVLLASFCALVLACGLTACGKDPNDKSTSSSSSSSSSTGEAATYSVTYDAEEGIIFSEDNDVEVIEGEDLNFTLRLSVFYEGEPTVKIGDRKITGRYVESTGLWSYAARNVSGNLEIKAIAENEENSENSVKRKVSSLGSSGNGYNTESPLLIKEPIDLLEMAEQINSGNVDYAFALYRLENDIDLKGEKLEVIGDGSTNYSYFGGYFNGNGKKISNFYIETENVNNVGLFGVVQGASGLIQSGNDSTDTLTGGSINSLTIENYVITASSDGSPVYCGSFIGQGFGATLAVCQAVNGKIEIYSDNDQFSYVGGLVGAQGSYENNSTPFFSTIAYCGADVEVSRNTGAVYTAGGIVGYLYSTSETVVSTVNNCYSTGSVTGAFYSGGIAGWLASYSGIMNCYSTGDISAQSEMVDNAMETFWHAYAGGIVGRAQTDTIIADSFVKGSLSAYSARGEKYAHVGKLAGYIDDGDESAEYASKPSTIYNCYDADSQIDFTVEANAKTNLKWHDVDWKFESGKYPVVNDETTSDYSFTLTFEYGASVNSKYYSDTLTMSQYYPMSFWYLLSMGGDSRGIPQLVEGENGYWSNGYYFDEDYTLAVPFGYIPTKNTTFYVKFSDYKEVAKTYYVVPQGDTGYESAANRTVQLILYSNANYECADDFFGFAGTYSYDSVKQEIIFYSGRFARYYGSSDIDKQSGLVFKADVTADGLKIYGGNYSYEETSNGSTSTVEVVMIDEEQPLLALNSVNTLNGTYYYQDGAKVVKYVFYTNGNGSVIDGSSVKALKYVLTDSSLQITVDNSSVSANVDEKGNITVGGHALKAVDSFAGDWLLNSFAQKYYTFDGAGNWTYTYGSQKQTGTYTLDEKGEKMTLVGERSGLAEFNADGLLEVEIDGYKSVYGKKDGYYGTWKTADGNVVLTFNGIGKDGLGEARITFISQSNDKTRKEIYDLNYSSDVITYSELLSDYGDVFFFYSGEAYGNASYSVSSSVMSISVFSISEGDYVNYSLYRVDEYLGEWVGDEVLKLADFNGDGIYAISGSLPVKGTLVIDGTEVTYTLNSDLTGTFFYKGSTYTLSYDDEKVEITLSTNGDSQTLVRKDCFGGLNFIDSEGTTYSFDGRGVLGKGKLTVSNSSVDYYYSLGGDGVVATISDGSSVVGNITIDADDNYVVKIDDKSRAIGVKTEYTGTWAVSAVFGYPLVVGTMNSKGVMKGSIPIETTKVQAIATEFTFEDDYLKCEVTVSESSVTFYVIKVADGEFVISPYINWFDYDGQYGYSMRADEFMGTWTNERENAELTFDGMGNSSDVYGMVNGNTVGNDEITANYYYKRMKAKSDTSSSEGDWILITLDEDGYVNAMQKIVECGVSDKDAYRNESNTKAFKLENVEMSDYITEID